jgi:hypothetical protein
MEREPIQAPANAPERRTARDARRDIWALIVTIALTATILGGLYAIASPHQKPADNQQEPAGGTL